MTKNELKFLCESQVAQIETWAEWKRERPHGKFYEACKSILELLDENELLVETLNECSRKRGHWVEGRTDNPNNHNILCSCCLEGYPSKGHANSQYTREKYKYCPNCGSYMREVEE
jgi:hypothetical protein